MINNIILSEKNVFRFILFIWILSIPFKNVFYQISFSLIIVFFIINVFRTKNFEILLSNLNETKYLFIGFLFIVFSMILSNLLNLGQVDIKSWNTIFMFIIRYGLLFLILSYFYKLEYFSKNEIIYFVVFSLILVLFTGIFQSIQNFDFILKGKGITGTLYNRNAFGFFMGLGFVLSFLLLKHKRNFALVLMFFFSFFMIFSFSRSSWVASVGAFFIFGLINYKNIKISHITYLFIFLLFFIFLYINFNSFQNRFEQLLDGNTSNRAIIWLHSLEFIKEKLFFGYGMDSFKNLPDSLFKEISAPHNMIVEILISIGLSGLIGYIFMICIILKKIYISKNLYLYPLFIYLLIVVQFDFGIFTSKELLSFLTIFIFFVYSDNFRREK